MESLKKGLQINLKSFEENINIVLTSVADPKILIMDPDSTFQSITDLDPDLTFR